jgi:hypothetical protein
MLDQRPQNDPERARIVVVCSEYYGELLHTFGSCAHRARKIAVQGCSGTGIAARRERMRETLR